MDAPSVSIHVLSLLLLLLLFLLLQVGDKGAEFDHNNRHFVTFPYPYMNGQLHLGHTFTISKVRLP